MKRSHRPDVRAGAAAVEFALAFPLMLLLFAIAVDYAQVYQQTQTLSVCARNGAMYAADIVIAQDSPYDTVEAVVRASAGSLADSIIVQSVPTTDDFGNACIDVTVQGSFKMAISLPGFSEPVTVSRTVRARLPRSAQEIDETL